LVEDWREIVRFDSITVTFNVFDDPATDPAGARGEAGSAILHARSLGSDNVVLNGFGPNVNGHQQSSPVTVTTTITDATELSSVLGWMENHDGHLRLRLRSTNGDYDISGDPTIAIEATETPEPVTFGLIGFGLAGVAIMGRRFKHK